VRRFWRADVLIVPRASGGLRAFSSVQGGVTTYYNSFRNRKYESWEMHSEVIGTQVADYWDATKSLFKGAFGFGTIKQQTFFIYCAPHWFFVLLALIFATLPWLHWSRRFSLRTLFIAITIISLALGVVVYITQQIAT
jgi:hypothetical protein